MSRHQVLIVIGFALTLAGLWLAPGWAKFMLGGIFVMAYGVRGES